MAGVKGKSGAKAKPNNKKLLAGSKHANQNAVDFELIENVDAPEWLDALAKQMWQTVCPHLCKERVLAVTDLHNLEAFCSAYSIFRQSEKEILANGIVVEGATGGPVKNPALTAKSEALRHMSMFGSALGLDPASRGRLMSSGSGDNSNPFNDF